MLALNDSGTGALLVPCFTGVPVGHELALGERFADGVQGWAQLQFSAREMTL
jgi:hypothetical protein